MIGAAPRTSETRSYLDLCRKHIPSAVRRCTRVQGYRVVSSIANRTYLAAKYLHTSHLMRSDSSEYETLKHKSAMICQAIHARPRLLLIDLIGETEAVILERCRKQRESRRFQREFSGRSMHQRSHPPETARWSSIPNRILRTLHAAAL